MTLLKCRGCGAPIRLIKTTAGKWMPCNPDLVTADQVEKGTWLFTEDGVVNKNPTGTDRGFVPHWKDCPAADRFRKKPKPKSNKWNNRRYGD